MFAAYPVDSGDLIHRLRLTVNDPEPQGDHTSFTFREAIQDRGQLTGPQKEEDEPRSGVIG